LIPPSALAAALRGVPELCRGEVWLTGAGPGDPAHLSLYALAGLMQADAIVYDALVDPRVIGLAAPGAKRIFAGKRGGRPSAEQADINDELVRLARQGARVLRLKGGDPCIFGRGADEMLALARHGIPFRLVPGITAGLAALTMALIPATVRGVNRGIFLATGHGAEADAAPGNSEALDWAAVARLGQPIVLYMALVRVEAIVRTLLAGGLSATTPAAAIAAATLPTQRLVATTLADLPDAIARNDLASPAIVVIGDIVRVRTELLALMPMLARETLG
jgi:uroporphyrin-III C-methyltransferase